MSARYWLEAGRSIARNLKYKDFRRNFANAGLHYEHETKLPIRSVLDEYPDASMLPIEMGTVAYSRNNLDPMERYVLSVAVALTHPKRIFEIGTFDGATTLMLAKMATEAEIFTLDLPPESAGTATVSAEVANAQKGVGSRFHGTAEAERISQLFGDSRRFDYGPWLGSIDLVLIDGGHEYQCVKSDTENAHRLISPRGVIIWDDYNPGWPGVVRAVEESSPDPKEHLVHIASTDFAVFRRRELPHSTSC